MRIEDILDTVICGNCSEVLGNIPENSIDLTVTSPPYDNLRKYNGYTFDFESIARQLYRVTKIGGVVVWIVADQTKDFCESLSSFKQALYFVDNCGFNLLDTMIWEKPNYAPGYPTLRRYDNNFEYMFVFSKGKPTSYNLLNDKQKKKSSIDRSLYKTSYAKNDMRVSHGPTFNGKLTSRRNNVWNIPNGQQRNIKHSAPFPEQLAEDHILSWSNPGDIVLDPMCGSGTTLKMARKNGRRYIGLDISDEYCELSRRRVALAEGKDKQCLI